MKEPLVSIIVPVFNSDKYLKNCINSIVNQSYRNLEILLIDDGSTDQSGQICDEYAQKDDRIRIFHNTNHGVSYSRNCGLNVANGDYIAFVDSDDRVSKEYIKGLLFYIKKYDLVISGIVDFWPKSNSVVLRKPVGKNFSYTLAKDFWQLEPFLRIVWGKLYRNEIIKEYNIRFAENISFGEDQLFNFKYYKHIKTCMLNNDVKYIYNRRGNGSLRTHSEKSDNLALVKLRLIAEKNFLECIDADYKDLILCNSCIGYWLYAGSGYHKFKKRCQIIRAFLNGRYASESLKRWLVLKCIKYQIYRLIYFYYRTKYLLHKWGI